ncbi:hypothetical protein RIF29_10079 [Crotalaria pallida]|uniref:Uncharacterized protein n=1 Tax=Crotalaria pallida TaxID=3830 RepID=A0AAN9IJQ4_CROPI
MKRVWRFSSELQFNGISLSLSPKSPKPIPIPIPFSRSTSLLKPSYGFATCEPYAMTPNKVSGIIPIFTAKPGTDPAQDLTKRVAFLMNELVPEASDSDRVRAILDEKFYDLIMWSQQQQQQHPVGSALLELLKRYAQSINMSHKYILK